MPAAPRFRRSGARGASLVEFLVALAIFAIIAVAAYTAFDSSNKVYRRGESSAEMQQRTRLAFELMISELRLAGFDFNRDGEANGYPDHLDEQIEYVGAHALTFRGNLDYDDATSGREAALEVGPTDPDYQTVCCPVVTTANDEIVTYALRADDATVNTGTIELHLDTSAPRDAVLDDDGNLAGEETVTIENVDLTDAHPPYTLIRFALSPDGGVTETPVASNVRTLTFTYEGSDGTDYYCTSPGTDGTCATGDQVAFTSLLGHDDLATGDQKGRAGRAAVRRISVEVVGMTELDDHSYADAEDTLMPHRRKLALAATVVPQNLGLKGTPDIEDMQSFAPTNVTLCGGQCNTVRVEWDDVPRASAYRVNLFLGTSQEPFFTGVTPGVAVADTDPLRVFAVFQASDAGELVEGAAVHATVESRLSDDEYSEPSEPSAPATLADVTRLEAPRAMQATGYDPTADGWPNVVDYELAPLTAGESTSRAQVNKVTVSWLPPDWQMDVTDQADPAVTWTTRVANDTLAALACDAEPMDSDGDTTPDRNRTRVRELTSTRRYFVFRSSNPRFVPAAADLVATIRGDLDPTTGRVTFTDTTDHVFSNGIFNRTVSALENCKTYYYRVRAVDDCFAGTDPAARDDMHLSPFQPPLNPASDAVDSDDIGTLSQSEIGLAIPGYAIPQAAPRGPANVRFTGYETNTDDGDGKDATISFGAVKLDNHLITNDQGELTPDFADITIGEYHVWSHPSNANFSLADALGGDPDVRFEKSILIKDLRAGRIAYDDENGDGSITTAEDESFVGGSWPSGAAPVTGLRVTTEGFTRWYRVAAVQCAAEATVPSAEDPTSYDYGLLSTAVKFPCEFGGSRFSWVDCNSQSFPSTVTATAYMDDPTVTATHARLVLLDPSTGDRAISASPGKVVNDAGVVTFTTEEIAALSDNFGNGDYRVSVEMDDSNQCTGYSDSTNAVNDLPSCCLASGPPVALLAPSTVAHHYVRETCGASQVRIYSIRIEVGNENRGQPERISQVKWNGQTIWTGTGSTTVTIDRSGSPLILTSGAIRGLDATFTRVATGDSLTVTYTYKIAGANGTCTFVQTAM